MAAARWTEYPWQMRCISISDAFLMWLWMKWEITEDIKKNSETKAIVLKRLGSKMRVLFSSLTFNKEKYSFKSTVLIV